MWKPSVWGCGLLPRFVNQLLLAGGLVLAGSLPVLAQVGELQSMAVTPAAPTADDAVVLHAITNCSNPFSGAPTIAAGTITLDTSYLGLFPPCAAGLPPFEVSYELGVLTAGTYTVEVIGNGGAGSGTVVASLVFEVSPGHQGGVSAPHPALHLSPSSPTRLDHVIVHASIDSDPVNLGLYPQFVVSRAGNRFDISTVGVRISPVPPGPYAANLDLGKLPPGVYQVVLAVGGSEATASFAVSEPAKGLLLDGGAFEVKVLRGAVLDGGAIVGGQDAAAVQVSDQSGYFWFFASSNMEITVKLLDGHAVNGHFWLFAASMTDQPFVLELIDLRGSCTGTSCIKLYAGAAGKNQSIIDLAAAS